MLTPADYDSFLKLTLTKESVDEAGITRLDWDQMFEILGFPPDSDGGIDFPRFLPPFANGTHDQPVGHRIRQDEPVPLSKNGDRRKYLAPPGKTYPYFPPQLPADWWIDKEIPAIVVEAEKSALVLYRVFADQGRKVIPIAIGGCWGWSSKTGIAPGPNGEREEVHGLNDLLSEMLRGRRVYVLMDVNELDNFKVRLGRDRFAQELLSGITMDVRLLHMEKPIGAVRWNGPDDYVAAKGDRAFLDLFESSQRVQPGGKTEKDLGSHVLKPFTSAHIYTAQEIKMDFLVWPFFSRGQSGLLDGWPKLSGKTTLILSMIRASILGQNFFNRPTQPMRTIFLSELSASVLGMQMRAVGFTYEEAAKLSLAELLIVPRDEWMLMTYRQILEQLDSGYLSTGDYNTFIADTFHAIARLEDSNDDAEVLAAANATNAVGTKYNLAELLNRHERKSGGDIGISGRNSLALTGAVDNIFRLAPTPGKPANYRKLEMLGRGFSQGSITFSRELSGEYILWRDELEQEQQSENRSLNGNVNLTRSGEKQKCVDLAITLLEANPKLTAVEMAEEFQAAGVDRSASKIALYLTTARKILKTRQTPRLSDAF